MKKMIHRIMKAGIIFVMFLAFSISSYAIDFNAETLYNSVFVVYSGNALGSGFAMGNNCIITNAHVIEDSSNVTIKTYDGKSMDASVVAKDDDLDIAVIAVEGGAFTPLSVGKEDDLSAGSDVYAIGAPKSLDYTLTKGIISAKSRMVGGQSYIQTDAAINEGNSGGPLINVKGEVIGVNSLKISGAEGIGLSIPISRVCTYLEDQGIELTGDNNVSGTVEPKGETSTDTSSDNQAGQSSGVKTGTNWIVIIIAGVSVLINIILLIVIINLKRKLRIKEVIQKDNTDFEIEFLE